MHRRRRLDHRLLLDHVRLRQPGGGPIVLYTPDWETYRRVRGVYFDVVAEPPGVVAVDLDQLVEAICTDAHTSPEAQARLEAFRQRFCPYDDGRAAERVVRRVFLEQRSS